ncbi:LptF/LptG family permease [candidate division KSB1 bacterium]|nr:LptF/LptG family permease [candidate division KSB1 bacterium]
MRILDKYILHKFVLTLIFALFAFCLIFIIIDLIEYLDKFIDKSVPYTVVINYYIYYLPYIIVLSLPVAVLLASLFSVGQMTRNNEIVAMKAAGISLVRILLPLFIFGFLLSLLILYLAETFVPMTNEKKIDIYREYVQNTQNKRLRGQNDVFLQLGKGEWLNIGFFDPNTNTGHRVSIQKFNEDFRSIARRIDAPEMTWGDNVWVLHDCVIRTFDKSVEHLARADSLVRSDFHVSPAELSRQQRKHEEMNFRELKQFIDNIVRNGGKPGRWLVDLHLKLSFPFANFIILLFGAPLASLKTRSGTMKSFGISLFICFMYFGIIKTGQALGHNGVLPPMLAAWMGNIIFGISAFYIYYKVRM